MYKRKKFSLFDTGSEGDPKRVFLDVLFVITGPLIIVPYSMLLGVIWTILAAAFLVLDVVHFVRKKKRKKNEEQDLVDPYAPPPPVDETKRSRDK